MRLRSDARTLLTVLAVALLTASGRAAAQAPSPQLAASRQAGEAIYGKWCADCHATPTGPGTLSLERKYHGDPPAILNQRTDLNPDYVAHTVRRGISFMPSFRKTEITDAELADINAYLATPSEFHARTPPAHGQRQ